LTNVAIKPGWMTATALAVAVLWSLGATADTPPSPTPGRAQVLVVGTYHMADPGRDLIDMPADDVTTEQRQRELEDLVSRLARFRPTRVAVEVVPERAAELDRSFRQAAETGRLPGPSETYQVGFRLAQRLDLPRVDPVDHPQDLELGQVMGWIAANDPEGMATFQRLMGEIQARNVEIMQGTVPEIFLRLNSPEQDELHGHYLWLAQKGTPSSPVGADVVADWYERNLKIFANVARLAETPEARVLVLVGAGHATLLREFVRQSPNLEAVDPRPSVTLTIAGSAGGSRDFIPSSPMSIGRRSIRR